MSPSMDSSVTITYGLYQHPLDATQVMGGRSIILSESVFCGKTTVAELVGNGEAMVFAM